MIDSLIDSYGYVYVDIKKGMYGLKQASVIAYKKLVKHIYGHGYYNIPFTTGLWSHRTLKTKFCLVWMILESIFLATGCKPSPHGTASQVLRDGGLDRRELPRHRHRLGI